MPNQNHIRRGLVADPDGRHYFRMKNAIWLYLYLALSVNPHTGKLLSKLDFISSQMGISKETLQTWLGHLKKWGYVSTQRQGESILFKLSRWREPNKPTPKQETKSEENSLASEIAETFEDKENIGYYQWICENYPENSVKRAFLEVKKMPNNKIKKSRGALFTYLVKKYSQK
jgi:DNA-binding transcriptional ArsR family regulator